MAPRALFFRGSPSLNVMAMLWRPAHLGWTIAWIWVVAIAFILWCLHKFVPRDKWFDENE